MTPDEHKQRGQKLDLVGKVDLLNDEVKTLALNLAVQMAKVRSKNLAPELVRMEPQFIRLVNGAVKAVKDMAIILEAARNKEIMAYDVPSGKETKDRIEYGLRSILSQCNEIMETLNSSGQIDTGANSEQIAEDEQSSPDN